MAVKLTIAAVVKRRRHEQHVETVISVVGPLLERVLALEHDTDWLRKEADGLRKEISRKRKIDAVDPADEMSGIAKSTKWKRVEGLDYEVEFVRVD